MSLVGPERGALRTDRILLLAITLVAWGWALWLPFQLDDHTFLRALHVLFGGGAPGETAPSIDGSYLFRPVQLVWLGVWMLPGTVCSSVVFHAASLALHALCVLLLHKLLTRWISRGAALAGAVVCAVMPAGGEAVTWIAASCDLLSMACALAAALMLTKPEPRTPRQLLLAGAFAGLGLLSKESMLAVIPLLGLLACCSGAWQGWNTALRRAAWFATLVLAALILRALVMGSLSFEYAGGRSASLSMATLEVMAGKLPDLLAALFAPWTPSLEGAFPAQHGVSKFLVVLALVWFPLACALRSRRVLLALLGLCVLWPAPLFAAPAAEGEVFSRSLYMSVFAFAIAFGLAADEAVRRWRGGKVLVLTALIAVLGFSVEALLRYRDAEQAAGERFAQIHAAVATALERGHQQQPVVALNVPDGFHGIPLIGGLLPLSFEPPFTAAPLPVLAFANETALFDAEQLVRSSARVGVTVLHFNDAGAVVHERRLPAGDPEGPCTGPDAEGWYSMASGFAPRGAPELELLFAAGEAAIALVRIESTEGTVTREIPLAASAGHRSAQLLLDHDAAWMFAQSIRRVQVTGAPLLRAPVARSVEPAAEITQPSRDEEWPLQQPLCARVRGLPGEFHLLRLHFQVHTGDGQWSEAMLVEIPRAGLARTADILSWTPSPSDKVIGIMHPALRPETVERMCMEHMKPRGLSVLHMRLRADATAADGTVLGRSPWRVFLLRF